MIEFSGWLQLWWQDHPVPPYADCHCTCCQAHQKASQMPTNKVKRFSCFAYHLLFMLWCLPQCMCAPVHQSSGNITKHEIKWKLGSRTLSNPINFWSLLIILIRDEDIRIMGQRGEFRGEYRLGVTKGEFLDNKDELLLISIPVSSKSVARDKQLKDHWDGERPQKSERDER